LTEIRKKYALSQYKKIASEINKYVNASKDNLVTTVFQQAEKDHWSKLDRLESLLMISYCNIIVMLESRNSVREYEYMDFSRRIGELYYCQLRFPVSSSVYPLGKRTHVSHYRVFSIGLGIWDSFCKLCFEHPVRNDISLFVPPLFSEVRRQLTCEIIQYIDSLHLTDQEKNELKLYYDKVWGLVISGEVKLELDLHFIKNSNRYVVDFKSGFGSNEKGNLNRLLLVGSIYKILADEYHCLLFVRSDENNSYFNTLKNSGIWESYCGNDTYQKIHEFSGYDLKTWIRNNIDWYNDISPQTVSAFQKNNLMQYLSW
jgi:hypothetical protein